MGDGAVGERGTMTRRRDTSGSGSTSGQPPSGDPHANLKPHERHLMSELLRLSQFLDDIPDGPDGMPLWTPEERELLAAAERLEGRPLSEPEKRLWVAQARMIGNL